MNLPRSIWKGSIGFGMAHIPVKLYTAVREQDVKFKQWDPKTASFPRQVNLVTDEVGTELRITKGEMSRVYVTPEGTVEVTDEDLSRILPVTRRHMKVATFVPRDAVDPLYVDKTYFLAPDGPEAEYAFSLFFAALNEEGKTAISKVVMRTKEHLVMIHLSGGAPCLSTMFYADEVADENVHTYLYQEVTEDAVETARELVRAYSSEEFDPREYHDEHRERILEMVATKMETNAGPEGDVFPLVPAPKGDILTLIKSELEERAVA